MVGHIKLDRKILDWEWYKDVNMSHLFVYLILKANFKDGKWRGISIKRGQLITGRLRISADTGLSEREIRTCLNKLKTTNEISVKTTNQYSIITICKYDTYQSKCEDTDQQLGHQSDQRATNERPTSDQRATTIEEELIKEKNDSEGGFKTYMPKATDFNGLPDNTLGASIELIRITKRIDMTKEQISGMWGVFKVQNLTGKKYYSSEDDVYSHFIHWIKKQDFKEDGKLKQPKISL